MIFEYPQYIGTNNIWGFFMKKCPKCDRQFNNDVKFCTKCGIELIAEDLAIWTWLLKSKRKHMFRLNDENVSKEAFLLMLFDKLDERGVPCSIKPVTINWNRDFSKNKEFIVDIPTLQNSPITYVINYDSIGEYVFIEEKAFITPPLLPPEPRKEITRPPYNPSANFIRAIVMCFIGYFMLYNETLTYLFSNNGKNTIAGIGLIIILIGLCIGCWACYEAYKLYTIKEYNDLAVDEKSNWMSAWKNWEKTQLNLAFVQITDNKIGHLYSAVSACIEEVCHQTFKDIPESLECHSCAQNELETQVSYRISQNF